MTKTRWIARDKNGGRAYLFKEKPVWDDEAECWEGELCRSSVILLFPEVTWENSPMQVELKLMEGNG